MENEKNKTASDTLRLCEVFTEVGNRYGVFHKWINDKDEHNRTRVSAIIEYTDGTCEIIRIGRFRFLDYLAERILEPYITK